MTDAALMLRELSEPWSSGERIKNIIDRTSRLASLSYSRTYEIWYRRARRIEPHEIAQIAGALRIKNEKAARNELHELKVRIAKLEAKLLSGAADFHSPSTDQAGEMVHRSGGKGGAMAGR